MTLRHRPVWPLALLLLGAGGNALAQVPEDGLTWRAGYALQRDDNLFRLPDGVDPRAVLGSDSAAETVTVRSLGLAYAKSWSLQRVEIDLGLVDYRYRTYRSLDLTAKNYDLAWRWAVTPRLRGSLTASRDETVNAFDNASRPDQGNRRLTRREAFDAAYELDGAWRLVAGAGRTRNINQQPQRGEDSEVSRSADIGLRHEAGSGSTATLRLRHGTGRTLGEGRAPASLRDDAFSQDEALLELNWVLTGKLSTQLSVARVRRQHDTVSLRDYSGTNASVAMNWRPTAKTQLSLRGASQLSSYQTNTASVARTDTVGLDAMWQIGSRTSLTASLAESRRRYLQPLPGQSLDSERERTRNASLGIRWAITPHVSLDGSLQRTRRSGNQPNLNFASTQAYVGVGASF